MTAPSRVPSPAGTMSDAQTWLCDTSVYTHLARAGYLDLLRQVSPNGTIYVPPTVSREIDAALDLYSDIPAVSDVRWARMVTLTDDEDWTSAFVKADLGGVGHQNLGESELIACAVHRGWIALMDDRAATTIAARKGVRTHDTLWVVVEACSTLPGKSWAWGETVVDDLLATGMWLPVLSGRDLFAWADEQGLVQRD